MEDNFFNLKNFFKKNKHIDSEIEKYVVIQDYLIVLLKSTSKVAVITLDLDGNLLWKIKNKNYFDHKNSYYSNIYVHEGKLFIYNTAGVELTVNAKTGEITNEEFIK